MNECIFDCTKEGSVSIQSNIALGQYAFSIINKTNTKIQSSVLSNSKFKLRSYQVFNRKYGETILDFASRRLAR